MMNLDNLKELAANLPAEYKENAEALVQRMGEVIEGIGDEPSTWRPSLLRLVQGTTDRGSIPRGTTIGDFVMGEERVERPLKVIPLIVWDGRQRWSPDQNESKVLCSSPDAKLGYVGVNCADCQYSKWNEAENKSECSKIKHMLCIRADLSDVFHVQFSKTNYVTGLDFVSLMKKAGVSPYRRIYELDSKTSSKAKNVENFTVKPADDKATKPELVEFLSELFRMVQVDRKESLEKFHISVAARRDSQPALAAPASADATILLTDETGSESNVSDLAKNYVV